MPEDPESKIGIEGLHRRLLARLREGSSTEINGAYSVGAGPCIDALRATLTLHKPEFFGGVIACLACSPGMPPPLLVEWKDCETVKVIASALGVET